MGEGSDASCPAQPSRHGSAALALGGRSPVHPVCSAAGHTGSAVRYPRLHTACDAACGGAGPSRATSTLSQNSVASTVTL